MSDPNFKTRIVSAGIDKDRARLCVNLVPTADADMENWPEYVDSYFRSGDTAAGDTQRDRKSALTLGICAGSAPTESAPAVDKRRQIELRYTSLGGRTETVNRAWQELGAWSAQALVGDWTNASDADKDRAKNAFWTALANLFAADGEAHKAYEDQGKAAIAPARRADTALLHILERAERTAAMMVGAWRSNAHAARQAINENKRPNSDLVNELAAKLQGVTDPDAKKTLEQQLKDAKDKLASETSKEFDNLRRAEVQSVEDELATILGHLDLADAADPPDPERVRLRQYPLGELSGHFAELATLHRAGLLKDADNVQLPKNVVRNKDYEAYKPSGPSESNYKKLDDRELDARAAILAQNFYAVVRGYPSLCRLFRFTVDASCALDDLKKAAADARSASGEPALKGQQVSFFLLSLSAETDALWSISKLRLLGESNGQADFWPATREEMELANKDKSFEAIRASGQCGQIDGVVDLNQSEASDDLSKGRYDLVTLDAVQAMESSLHALDPEYRQQKLAMPSGAKRKGIMPVGRSFSRGLAIFDRQRAKAVCDEIEASKKALGNSLRVIDADDLTIGYRADVAYRGANGSAEWRSLMERSIAFDADYEALLADIGLKRATPERRELDAAVIMPASRIRLLGGSSKTQRMIHPEETLVAWEGATLGLNCAHEEIVLAPSEDIGLTRVFSLPSDKKPWRLQFGVSYRMGMRPVWMGGVSLGSEQAGRIYDSENMALPASDKPMSRWRRFLRHEQVHPPVALLPKGIAEERTPYARQSVTQIILRATSGPDASERDVSSTWRVILPPKVSLDMATRHQSLTTPGQGFGAPRGAFHGIAYRKRIENDTKSAGPAAVAKAPKAGSASDQKNDHPQIDPEAGFPVFGNSSGQPSAEPLKELKAAHFIAQTDDEALAAGGYRATGEPVFMRETASSVSRGEYYSDPMCSQLVVAVRPLGTRPGEGYFGGNPVVVDLGGAGRPDMFDKIMPVALVVERRGKPPKAGDRPQQAHFLSHSSQPRKISDGADPFKGGDMPAKVVKLTLGEGESVEVDCWFAPSETYLSRFFDAPEALAALVFAPAVSGKKGKAEVCEAIVTALKDKAEQLGGIKPAAMSSEDALANLRNALRKAYDGFSKGPAKDVAPWSGPGGESVDPLLLTLASAAIGAAMRQRPVPEIAAVRTFGAVYAVAKPPRAPSFVLSADKVADLAVYRTGDEKKRAELIKALKPAEAGTTKQQPSKNGEKGDDTFVFAGKVRFDRDTCRQLEIIAECVAPGRNTFDDVRLGRTQQEQVLGTWPSRIRPDSGAGKLSSEGRYLFGFDIDRSGKVTHLRQEVTVLQIDHVAETEDGEVNAFWATETLDLVDQQSKALDRQNFVNERATDPKKSPESAPALRFIQFDPFKDQFARRLKLYLRATSRFDSYFLKIVPDKEMPVAERIYPDDVDVRPDSLARITTTSCDLPGADGNERIAEVWVPATARPIKPQVHTVLPAFNRKPNPFQSRGGDVLYETLYTYSTRLRVYLDRPWFSSGEGEKLGVVLWPPRIASLVNCDQQSGKMEVPRNLLFRDGLGGKEAGNIVLTDIADEDLGPGGQFTTRMGADPIREASDTLGPFLPITDFLDLDTHLSCSDGKRKRIPQEAAFRAGYVEHVYVPIQDPSETKDGDRADFKPIAMLAASLLTYEPYFDPQLEKWYVDIDINPESLVDPFVRVGLVRYQEHAHEDLKVSAPVKVWAQVRPQRKVQARVTRVEGKVVVDVQVSGSYAARIDDELGRVHPRMLITLRERRLTLSGHVEERIIRQEKADKTIAPAQEMVCLTQVCSCFDRSGALAYYNSFCLSEEPGNPETANCERHLIVTVEELDAFLSTNDTTPPHAEAVPTPKVDSSGVHDDGGKTDDFVRALLQEVEPLPPSRVYSGPLFVAKVDLTFASK